MISIRQAGALLLHQIRLLREHRTACLVLALFIVVSAISGWRPAAREQNTCYLVYWRHDPLVERLQREMNDAVDGFRIVVAPVTQFVDRNGRIAYPEGAHSVQLRPPEQGRPNWLIWCWYSGVDPTALDPVIDWFRRVAETSFEESAALQVRVSALRPVIPMLEGIPAFFRWSADRARFQGALVVWTATFFCSCYLPAVILASQREHGSIQSVVASPVGWRGIVLSTCVFYMALSVGLAAVLLAVSNLQQYDLLPLIALCSLAYLGVGSALGLGCRSTISASSGIGIYFVVPALLLFINQFVPTTWTLDSLESAVIVSLNGESELTTSCWAVMILWVALSITAGFVTYRRLVTH